MNYPQRIFTFLLAFFLGITAFGQSEKMQHQVFLTGNICDAAKDPSFVAQLENILKTTTTPYTILLNGDLTNAEIGSVQRREQVLLLKTLIKIVDETPLGNIILSAGDRDWNGSKQGGQRYFENLEKEIKGFIKTGKYKRAEWANKDGCPGPEVYDLDENLLLIVANSQWWNHPFDKPRPEDGLCTVITSEDFAEELESEVAENQDKNIIIAGHHPIESLGNYGGYFSVADHLKPFPILGTFRTSFRKNIGTTYDISNKHLHAYREEIYNLFFFHKNLIYVSAHEKNQQIIQEGENYWINSGAPSKGKFAAKYDNALLSSKKSGVIVLNYFDNGKVTSTFLARKKDGFKSQANHILFQSSCDLPVGDDSKIPLNDAYVPCDTKTIATKTMSEKYGSVNTVAGAEYKAGGWKRMWLGNHYRTTWTAPVNVPTLDLDTTFGGLTIFKKGGGRQTTSLKFKSKDDTRYTFRSVNKDPSKAFNYKLRPTFITPLFRDQTSTQQPYGAMVVAPLLDEIGILHASPTLYVLPDDKKLGSFQKKYGGLLGMLEDSPSKANDAGELFGGADKIYQSNKLFKKLYDSKKNQLDEKEFIKARIFDILIGDWSKHEDNWKWAAYKKENHTYYRPIPRDRDHAFSRQDGIIPWLASREWAVKNIETFEHEIKGLRSLMYQAIHMDRFLSTSATREDWIAAAKDIQANISDAEIEQAVKNMPLEIMNTSGKTIESKLKARIKDLDEYAEKYYKMLAEYVDVVGSNDEEYFEIFRHDDGKVTVKIFDTKKNSKGSELFYSRTFIPKETKEIRIYGLGDDDIFDIQGNGKSSIILRLLGNSGDDTYLEKNALSKTKTLIYDKGKNSKIETSDKTKIVNHWNKEMYEYDRSKFLYHSYLPIFGMGYNTFNGFSLKLGATFTRQNFGKEGYSSKHSIYASGSTESNLGLHYSGRFHQVLKNWDIPFLIDFASPEFRNNFYGLGNNTTKDDDLVDDDFYRFFHKTIRVETGIGKSFWKKSSFDLTFGFAQSDFQDTENTILDTDTPLFGAENIISEIPIKAALQLDFRDKSGFAYNGVLLLADYQYGTIIDGTPETETYGIASSSMEYYISNKKRNPITLGLRVGGAVSHGKTPFYHLPNIGSANGLRGYFGERFSGESSLYFNSDFRWQLFERNTSFVPIKFGLKAFYDVGKVYMNGETENNSDWHTGYGAGIFIVPLDEAVSISLTVGFSEEESFFPILSFGRAL